MKTLAVPLVVAVCALSFLSGCGSDGNKPSTAGYAGTLYVSTADADHPSAGAAGNIVDCANWGSGGSPGTGKIYGEGATSKSADAALVTARSEGGFGGVQEGLVRTLEEDNRVLYVLEVDHQVKQAVIVRNGPAAKGTGGDGWFVETWAKCDDSEMPRAYLDSKGLQIWNDANGVPVSTKVLEVYAGPQHCNWESMTFLSVDKYDNTFVRKPLAELADNFDEKFQAHADLPASAVDTGYERDGKHLWVSPDSKRAYVGTKDDVEVWPAEQRPLGCD